MQPDCLNAFHQALRLGPDFCPPDLFDGTVPAIVRGLRAHANNIAYARHMALEETYPRLARRMAPRAFREAAERFLELDRVLARSLDLLGQGFEQVLTCRHERDLARAEWAWLHAFHARDAEALTLPSLAQKTADELIEARVMPHPAARWVQLEAEQDFVWDHSVSGDGDFLLVTRPNTEVLVRRIDQNQAKILTELARHSAGSSSINDDPATFIALVQAGAIMLENPA